MRKTKITYDSFEMSPRERYVVETCLRYCKHRLTKHETCGIKGQIAPVELDNIIKCFEGE